MMRKICCGSGAGMELCTDWVPPGGDFVLRFHHFGYRAPDESTWAALEPEIELGGWIVRSRSDTPGFVRSCYIEAPELGNFLEFVLPRQGRLERINAGPVA